jgi:hypothetical protein
MTFGHFNGCCYGVPLRLSDDLHHFAPPEDAQGANLARLADDDAAMITRSNAEVLLAI